MQFLNFLAVNWRLLTLGVFLCFCSSAGQTYFISLFGGEIRAAFDLSHGGFGTIYALGTLGSAATLIWLGRVVDRVPLPLVAAGVLGALGGVCVLMGGVWSTVVLVIAIFGLRLFGQGLAVHTAMTAMGRYFDAERGRAVSIAALGNAAGAALAPILVVAALALFDWRQVWVGTGIALFALAPFTLLLLRGHAARDRAFAERRRASGRGAADRTLGLVLADIGMWLRLPALLAPAFFSTGLIFHQIHLASAKGWPIALVAGSFSAYALASLGALAIAGPLVDRLTASRLMPFFLAPLALSCVVLALFDARWSVPLFLGLLGASTGVTAVVKGAVWAELYGVTHLGAIRAFGQSAMVFSSGMAPAGMGLLMDAGVSIEAIAAGSALTCVLLSALAAVPGRRQITVAAAD